MRVRAVVAGALTLVCLEVAIKDIPLADETPFSTTVILDDGAVPILADFELNCISLDVPRAVIELLVAVVLEVRDETKADVATSDEALVLGE